MSEAVYELEVNIPEQPEGSPIQIPGLGVFENGKKYEITEDEANNYRVHNSVQVPDIDEETHVVLGGHFEQGPSLYDAAQTMYGVNVTDLSSGKQSKDEEEPPPVVNPDPEPQPEDPDNSNPGGDE
jgi:hypothetical protein